jgi:hypothetical protein
MEQNHSARNTEWEQVDWKLDPVEGLNTDLDTTKTKMKWDYHFPNSSPALTGTCSSGRDHSSFRINTPRFFPPF